MKEPTEKLLTQKEIANLWNCHIKTVRRAIQRHRPKIKAHLGLEPALTLEEVEKLQAKVNQSRADMRQKLSHLASARAELKGFKNGQASNSNR